MSDSLTTLTTKIQAMLGDPTVQIFSSATVTAALRQTLAEWNLRAPIHAAELITGVNEQYEYELSDHDANALDILDVLRQGDNADELDVSLDFDWYTEDERVYFRLRRPVTTSETLIVRYTKNHTINGLDSATESTIPARWNQAMIDGGAFFSILIRATSRIEDNNLDKQVMKNYQDIAAAYGAAFALQMATATRKRKAPVSEPDARSWADGEKYNSWDT